MALTSAQLATLKAAILADPVFSTYPLTSGTSYEIAVAFNQLASPTFNVWRTEAPVKYIYDAIDWSKYTPVDAAAENMIGLQRLMIIQTKQMNLQNLLIGRDTVDASKSNTRGGLRDAVIALPAGAAGANVTAGGSSGVNVLNACIRPATRAEKLFTLGPATTGTVTADIMGFEGLLSQDDVQQARELP